MYLIEYAQTGEAGWPHRLKLGYRATGTQRSTDLAEFTSKEAATAEARRTFHGMRGITWRVLRKSGKR